MTYQPDPQFDAWRDSMPASYWAKHDVTDCRIGWDTAKAAKAAQPDSGRVGDEVVERAMEAFYRAGKNGAETGQDRMRAALEAAFTAQGQITHDSTPVACESRGEAVAFITHSTDALSRLEMTEAGLLLGVGKHACYTHQAPAHAALSAQGQGEAVAWKRGDDYTPKEAGRDMFTAGINVGEHDNAIECYADTAEAAARIRDRILAACESRGDVGVGVDTTTEGSHVCVRIGSAVVYSQFHPAPASSPAGVPEWVSTAGVSDAPSNEVTADMPPGYRMASRDGEYWPLCGDAYCTSGALPTRELAALAAWKQAYKKLHHRMEHIQRFARVITS
jgi:hypothetical protein